MIQLPLDVYSTTLRNLDMWGFFPFDLIVSIVTIFGHYLFLKLVLHFAIWHPGYLSMCKFNVPFLNSTGNYKN